MTSMTSVRHLLKGGKNIASLHSLAGDAGLIVVREERSDDIAAREALLDGAFGEARFAKTSEKLRAGRAAARGLSLVAVCNGKLIGTVRLWHVAAERGRLLLLLGPLAVADSHRTFGIGGMLMREAIARATARGHKAILLVGDEPYYQRFGFAADLTHALDLPGPVDRARFLGLELEDGALSDVSGMIRATGVLLEQDAWQDRELLAA